MELKDKVAVITGGTGGIGQAMARAFLTEGARTVVISDLNADRVSEVAGEIGCHGIACDVTNEAQVEALVEATLDAHGPVDLFCSNAGSVSRGVLTDATNEQWQQQWELHVMSHVYAARAVLPSMIARGEGYLLNTASAAGLLAAIPFGPVFGIKGCGHQASRDVVDHPWRRGHRRVRALPTRGQYCNGTVRARRRWDRRNYGGIRARRCRRASTP